MVGYPKGWLGHDDKRPTWEQAMISFQQEIWKGSRLREALVRRPSRAWAICLGSVIHGGIDNSKQTSEHCRPGSWGNNPGPASYRQKGTEHEKRKFPRRKSIKVLSYRSKGSVSFLKQAIRGQSRTSLGCWPSSSLCNSKRNKSGSRNWRRD